jgi:hypothetical protein
MNDRDARGSAMWSTALSYGFQPKPPKRADTIGPVPNKPKTPVSTFRIPPELKAAAMAKARANDTDLTAVIVKALERYVKAK